MSYRSVKLIKRPELEITPDIFDMVTQDIPSPAAGEVLVKLSHLSLDPAMRGWMDLQMKTAIFHPLN
ncbi:hypothetical protein [Marinomonas rhodophyticola]|uniref:hypothetical protein n=1 Tax=Marinomonas rhodophyticola TaxID=2992803 RepID=UPI002AA29F2E|nr:hypothetical protein [Marinomonas sp. KJ51-3]